MKQFERKIENVISGLQGRLLVAVSGGADSTALLYALCRLKRNVLVAHCNFHLRGEESDRDQSYVEDFCLKHGVELRVKHFDVPAYCQANKVSFEMACRDLRYEWFRQLMVENVCSRIAVAHNSDDNIETMLLNMFRGTGIDGLVGMKIDTGEIIRPLLQFTRVEIEKYLAEENVDYVIDSTNLGSDFKRNYIRNQLLPQLESRWQGIRRTLHLTQRNLQGVAAFYSSKIDEMLPIDVDFLPNKVIACAPDRVTLLHEFLKRHNIGGEFVVEMSDSWASGEGVGKRWLTSETEIVLDREGFRLLSLDDIVTEPILNVDVLPMTDELMSQIKTDRSQSMCYLPADDIAERTAFGKFYKLRQPRQGDRILPIGMKGSSLVSDVLKDSKLTIPQRRHYFLLEHVPTGEIIWLPGLKRSRRSLVSLADKTVYCISLT